MQEAESKLVMVTSLWNILDFLAFFPPLLELVLFHGANVPIRLGQFDFRWFKILRCGLCPWALQALFMQRQAAGARQKCRHAAQCKRVELLLTVICMLWRQRFGMHALMEMLCLKLSPCTMPVLHPFSSTHGSTFMVLATIARMLCLYSTSQEVCSGSENWLIILFAGRCAS